jgi:hypothetical protein
MTGVRAILVVASLLLASPSSAEPPPATPPPGSAPDALRAPAAASPVDPAAPTGVRVGLGVGIGFGGTPALFVPLDAGARRLEVEGAYESGGTNDLKISNSRLGLGLFGLWGAAPAVRGSAGARVRWERASVGEANADRVRIAAALGGEWVPVPLVSLGVEGQAGYALGWGGAVSGFDVSAQAVLRVFLSELASSGPKPGAATWDRPAPPRGKKCSSKSDCDGLDFCFDGVCRH